MPSCCFACALCCCEVRDLQLQLIDEYENGRLPGDEGQDQALVYDESLDNPERRSVEDDGTLNGFPDVSRAQDEALALWSP